MNEGAHCKTGEPNFKVLNDKVLDETEEISTIVTDYLPWFHNFATILIQLMDVKIGLFEYLEVERDLAIRLEKQLFDIAMEADVEPSLTPISEAAVERIFSRHKLVHTILRPRSLPNFVETVLFVKHNAKQCFGNLPIISNENGDETFYSDTLFELFEPN